MVLKDGFRSDCDITSARKQSFEMQLQRSMQGRSKWLASSSFVDELPRISAVEFSNANRCDELRVEIAKVDAVFATRCRLQGLPVGHASAGFAMNRAKGFVAPGVLGCCLRVAFNLNRTELEVDPRPANATTERAIAIGGYLWRGR